jgi:hypothetical protein
MGAGGTGSEGGAVAITAGIDGATGTGVWTGSVASFFGS